MPRIEVMFALPLCYVLVIAIRSVAQHVARHSPVPVLVLHERGGALTKLYPHSLRSVRVLVGLDGSSLAETKLVPAAYLSAAISAPTQGILHLARVIPWPAKEDVPPGDMVTAARELALSEVRAYLDKVEQRLQAGELAQFDLIITSSVAVRADVADTLISSLKTCGTGQVNEQEYISACVLLLVHHP